MMPTLKTNRGMTLIEITVAMAVTFIVAGAIFATYRTQQMTHLTQRALVEMNQNIRAAVYYLSRDIRLAGSDPTWGSGAGGGANSLILVANQNSFQFESDLDRSGAIDAANETIRYALNAQGHLGRATGAGALQTIAENIEAIDFEYFGYSAAPPLNLVSQNPDTGGGGPYNVSAANLGNISFVRVTIVARYGNDVPGMSFRQTDTQTYTNAAGDRTVLAPQNDDIRRTILTTEIQMRNM